MAPQREWFEKDYYKTLGISSTANAKEITSAYRKLAKKHHPDTNPGHEDTFKEISAAYDVLGDADRRKEYDEVRAMGPAAAGFGGGFPGGFGGGGGGGTFRVEDMGDLFGGLFGRGRRGGNATGSQRGTDVETELHLSFEDAVQGVTTSVNLTTDVRCHTCAGSGAAPGTQPVTCPRCGGSGTLQDNQGLFSLSQICPQCGGRGTIVTTPCPTCSGTGVEHRNRTVRVRIPPGVEDGQRIRVKGKGGAGRGNGPSGDLFVVVRVDRHGVFGRRGRNLTLARARLLLRGDAGHHGHRPHPDRTGQPPGPGRYPVGSDLPGQGPRRARRKEERHRRPAGHRGGGSTRQTDRRAARGGRGPRRGVRSADPRRTGSVT